MKIAFLGDSITQGVGASCEDKNYVSLVRDRLNCTVYNYGLSGTRIARQISINRSTIWNYDFRLRLDVMTGDCDLVFIFGGTNDYGHGALHLGNANTNDENTFCGQLRLLIEKLIQKYGKNKLCFILPLRRFDENAVCSKGENLNEIGATLAEYVDAMRQIISEYGIDFIDLYNNGIPKPKTNEGDEYTVDGVHPNDNGYRLIAEKVCDYINLLI